MTSEQNDLKSVAHKVAVKNFFSRLKNFTKLKRFEFSKMSIS